MKHAVIALLLTIVCTVAIAQNDFNYSQKVLIDGKETTLERFKGKPLILDLFNASCLACFKAMPQMDSLQRQYQGRINIVMLGNDREKLPEVFGRIKSKYSLMLEAVYDKALFKSFNAPYNPFYIWIDSKGRQIGSCLGEFVNSKNIASFLQGDYGFFMTKDKRFPPRDYLTKNLKNVALYGSILTGAIDSFQTSTRENLAITELDPSFEAVNCKLRNLLMFAYFGKEYWSTIDPLYAQVWKRPISEDSIVTNMMNETYCYGLRFSHYQTPAYLKQVMQEDLARAFGLTAWIEERNMPYWSLQRLDTSSNFLRSTCSERQFYSSYGGINMRCGSLHSLLACIDRNSKSLVPFVDETGVSWTIDIDLRVDMTDFEEVKKALGQKGLILVMKKRPISVLVVKQLPKVGDDD